MILFFFRRIHGENCCLVKVTVLDGERGGHRPIILKKTTLTTIYIVKTANLL